MKLTLTRSVWLSAVAALATLASAATGLGATYTWTAGGTGSDWFTSPFGSVLTANWSPSGSTLTSSDDLLFDATGGSKLTPNMNGNAVVNNLTFAAGAPGYTITGVGGSLTVNGSLSNASSSQQTIGSGVTFYNPGNGSTINTGAAGIAINTTAGFGGSGNFTKTGSGVLALNAASAYTGTMTLSAGSVTDTGGIFGGGVVGSGGNITTGIISRDVVVNAGSVISATTQIAQTATVTGGTLNANLVSGSYNQSGGIATVGILNDFSTLSGGTLTITGNIVQDMTQTGGTLKGTGGPNNDSVLLTEDFSISNGTAFIRGAKSVNQTGGDIKLSPGAITLSSTLNGVNSLEGPLGGNVAFNGGLTLGSGNSLSLDFDNAGTADKFTITGSPLNYGGVLNLNMTTSGTAANNTSWQLFQPTAGTSGSFASLSPITSAESSYNGLTWSTATSGNYYDQQYGPGVWLSAWNSNGQRFIFSQSTGVLTVVPEPSTIVFAGIGAAMLGWQTWAGRRRKARMKLIEEHTRKLSEQRGLV